MSPRGIIAGLYESPEHIQRIRSAVYPMQIAKSGSFLAKEDAHRSNIHFLLDFLRGAKFWQPNYGVDLDQLEQEGAELDTVLPVVSWQLRQNIEDYVPRVSVDGLIITRELQGESRKIRFDLLYRSLFTNRVARATIDDTLAQRTLQPNPVVRENFISNSVEIPWESEPPPAVDPFLSLARSGQEQSGYVSWGATETKIASPAGTNSDVLLGMATGAIVVAYNGPGWSGEARRYPGTVPLSTRHEGGWGLYYRGLAMVDSTNDNFLFGAEWGLGQNSNFPGDGPYAYFEVIGVGVSGSRVPSTLRAVVQDGGNPLQTQTVDLGINMVDEAHLLEIVIIPGAVKFFVDGEEKLNNGYDFPPIPENYFFGARFEATHFCMGDNPPGGQSYSFPTGFFTPNDGLRYERITGGGGASIKILESRFGFFDYPGDPPV